MKKMNWKKMATDWLWNKLHYAFREIDLSDKRVFVYCDSNKSEFAVSIVDNSESVEFNHAENGRLMVARYESLPTVIELGEDIDSFCNWYEFE